MNRLAAELEELGGAEITTALEDLPVPSFVLDPDGVIRWLNHAAREERGGASGRSWAEFVPDAQTTEAESILRQILCSGEPAELSIELLEPDGRAVQHEISAAPLKDGATVLGVFGVSTRSAAAEVPPAAPADVGITERQLEVLQLLAQGKSTAQIAEQLVLSQTTVRNHIAHLLANLGVHTRVQAVIAGSRLGLIRLTPPDDPSA